VCSEIGKGGRSMGSHRLCRRVAVALILFGSIASLAHGQTVKPDSLKGGILKLGGLLPAGVGGDQANAFANIIVLEISTAPFGTSTGGFTFHYDPRLRIFVRSSDSFGPLFVQRSLTAGKGKWDAGFNVLHANYNSLNGDSLDSGDLL